MNKHTERGEIGDPNVPPGRLPLWSRPGYLVRRLHQIHTAIFAEECRSLAHEAKGDLGKAIHHRLNEIRLIRRLHEISYHTANADFVLRQYSYADLADRLDLLAVLYHDRGHLDQALSTLRESKQVCKRHGIRFDGEDLLHEYLKEKGSSSDKHLHRPQGLQSSHG